LASYEDGLTNEPALRLYDLAGKTTRDGPPSPSASTGPLLLADFDGDRHLELFVGGRVVPGRFPEPAASQLCRLAPGPFPLDTKASQALAQAGLVSGAVASDLDGDGRPELVLACNAGPLRVFRFQSGQFQEVTDSLGFAPYTGLWTSVTAGDFDNDGQMDLVAGNWGRNTKYQDALTQPIHLYYGDLDEDGFLEVVEAYYDRKLNKIVPWRDWETLASAMPFIKERYPDFTSFSTASVAEFLGERRVQMRDLAIRTLESIVFLNRGDHFEAHTLPSEAQFSPVFGMAVGDLDGDGHEDVVVCQNFFQVPPQSSRLDAGRGIWLRGNGQGNFTAVPGHESGLEIYGEGRGLALCDYDHDGRLDVAAGQNGNTTRLWRNVTGTPGLRVILKGLPENPDGIGSLIRIQYPGGRLGPAREIHAGAGYWSQDAPTAVMAVASGPAEAVLVRWPSGAITRSPIPSGAKEIQITTTAPTVGD
jgi:hypothetical protein